MRLFGSKRTRSSKAVATLRVPPTAGGRLSERLRDRDVLLRLVLCLLALLAMLGVVQSWEVPFPYRLGDYDPNGILARTNFERVNKFKTDRAMLEREAQVPPVFEHDPTLIRRLPYQLRDNLLEVSDVKTLSELSAETRAAFGLAPLDGTDSKKSPPDATLEQQWQTLQRAVSSDDGAAERRVDEIIADFIPFIEPLRKTGVADPDELLRLDLRRPDETITVVSADWTDERQTVTVADVLLAEMLKSTGSLGREWKSYPLLEPLQPLLERWLLNRTPPTLRYDEETTRTERLEARLQSPPVTDAYKRGDLLVAPGQSINDEALEILAAQHEAWEASVSLAEQLIRVVVVFLMLLVLAIINGYYLVHNERRLVGSPGRLSIYLAALVVAVALGRISSFDPWRAEIIPLLATVMICAITYNQMFAMLTAITLTLILTMSTGQGLGEFVVLISAASVAVLPLSNVASRSALVKVGFWSALAYLAMSWGMGVIETTELERLSSDDTLLTNSLRGAGWCLAAGYLVAGSLPFVESAFGVVTDISLLELSDVSHPLLQELVRRAPGTYNHSITVATIAETAADSIGANGLLCRVGAYFHDIGKMLKPHYFIENIAAGMESRHQQLAPAMSTLIIIGHVKDGVDLANQYNLPQPLIDFIEQHHGTTLVEYFYHAAARQADPDHRTDVEESSFRYPGPKPQTREAGVLMLADAVEGASRTLIDPTPKRIETLVHEITMKRLLDGQFDESSLTLSQINQVEESLTKSLIGIYHGRIKYPEQRTA